MGLAVKTRYKCNLSCKGIMRLPPEGDEYIRTAVTGQGMLKAVRPVAGAVIFLQGGHSHSHSGAIADLVKVDLEWHAKD